MLIAMTLLQYLLVIYDVKMNISYPVQFYLLCTENTYSINKNRFLDSINQ